MSKRPQATLDTFFNLPPAKKVRTEKTLSDRDSVANGEDEAVETSPTTHPTYPFAIPHLPPSITESLHFAPAAEGRIINDQPDLDLLYYRPYIPPEIHRALFEFLRNALPFYRVKYSIKRGSVETPITTPRYTTVFGVDATSRFDSHGELVDTTTTTTTTTTSRKSLPKDTYGRNTNPRPIPQCLDLLRSLVENTTNSKFNFVLVNYYATGSDSISYHSDSESFLGPDPSIASLTLGSQRDFLLRHKNPSAGRHPSEEGSKTMKFPLGSGDMLLMRGRTQSHWEHSIPKRKGGEADGGRINVTFRRALVKGGTKNYYRYNVGEGPVYRWDERKREMVLWGGEG